MAASKLVIVESPAKARTIARFLGKDYKVEASQGHVRDFPKSQLGVDVDNDFALKYITIHGRGKILTKIRKEAKNASTVYLATDPDREGEAIAWHLYQVLGLKDDNTKRIVFHEITKNAILHAIEKEMKQHGILYARLPDLCGGDNRTQYVISPSDMTYWVRLSPTISVGNTERSRQARSGLPIISKPEAGKRGSFPMPCRTSSQSPQTENQKETQVDSSRKICRGSGSFCRKRREKYWCSAIGS